MKRWYGLLSGLAIAVALGIWSAPATAGTSLDINLHVGDPYPGGQLVFRDEPDIIVVPDTRVYYVRNSRYDLFRYGRYWYLCDDGVWFRARGYRGPFRHISFTTVPRAVVAVPAEHWHHWRAHPGRGYANGHYKNRQPERVVVEDRHRGNGNGHGNGQGRNGKK